MVRVGAKAPQYLLINVTTTGAGSYVADLTTVTGARLEVRSPRGVTTHWTASIEGTPSATALVLKHEFDELDLTVPGAYSITPLVSVGSDEFPCASANLLVQ